MYCIIKNALKKQIILIILGILLWSAIAIPLTLHYMDFGKDEHSKSDNLMLLESNDPNQIKIDLRIQYRDLAKRIVRYYISFQPYGNNLNNTTNRWAKDIEFSFIHETFNFENNTLIHPVAFNAPLKTGNIRDYPFDHYTTDISFLAYDTNTKSSISVSVSAFVYSQNTYIEFNRDESYGDLDKYREIFNINIKRTSIVYTFCTLIFIINWSLTIAIMKISIAYLIYDRELPPSIIPLGIFSLFALPNVRNTQPEIPEIGCAIDLLGFIWCEILLACASCLIVFKWILKWRPKSNNNINNDIC